MKRADTLRALERAAIDKAFKEFAVVFPLEPTKKMRKEGGRRLLRYEDDLSDSAHSKLQWAGAMNDAERVWRSMWIEAALAAHRIARHAAAKKRKESKDG